MALTPDSDSAIDRYRALLDVSESISLNRDLPALFEDLAQRLRGVVHFDYLNLVLHVPDRNTMRLRVLTSTQPTDSSFWETPVDETPSGLVWQTQQPLVIDDIDREIRYPNVMQMLKGHGMRSCCVLPLTTAQRPLGAMGLGAATPSAFDRADLEFLAQVARQVAVAVENVLNYEAAQCYQGELARERDRLQVVLDVTNAMVANLDLRELFRAVSGLLRRLIRHEYASLVVVDPAKGHLRLEALDFPGGDNQIHEAQSASPDDSPAAGAMRTRQPLLWNRRDAEHFPSEIVRRLLAAGLQSAVCIPLLRGDRALGTLNVASMRDEAFAPHDVELLTQIGNELAIAVENALAFRQIEELKDKLAEEKLYLEDEIRTEYDFEEIVGDAQSLKRVLRAVETVAPTDSTVLIQGESGTGKELIARAIHNLSGRRQRTFVKVNCAAIPTGLIESELFGHEKGAFTGAISQKIGRFELADKGTLFLDEIGDIPLELQPKLLRVLQEREFERLGSVRTVKVDIRLVTATNRDLGQMIANREFREDLFYRLNVFPITLPPLRERHEDIPQLVRYFTQKYARRMNRRIETIPSEAMEALSNWNWPGNVRELENFIERAVILTRGSALHVPLAELRNGADAPASAVSAPLTTLEEAEREHILRALRECNWVVGGPSGAAARLGLKRTTLQSRIVKLGIGGRQKNIVQPSAAR
ncbi:MAG: sigma 54-interacting transcriptional regulator [Bryobacteraceae bacterium]